MIKALTPAPRSIFCPFTSACCRRTFCRERFLVRKRVSVRSARTVGEETVRRQFDLVQDLRRDFRYDPSAGEPA